MIINCGNDSIRTVSNQGNGTYRAVRQGAWWVGDYETVAQAKLALSLMDDDGKYVICGISDGGDWASDEYIAQAQHDTDFLGNPSRKQPANVVVRMYIDDMLAGREPKKLYTMCSAIERAQRDDAHRWDGATECLSQDGSTFLTI